MRIIITCYKFNLFHDIFMKIVSLLINHAKLNFAIHISMKIFLTIFLQKSSHFAFLCEVQFRSSLVILRRSNNAQNIIHNT